MNDNTNTPMKVVNVMFSSTSQWNVGDEFILRGIMAAMQGAGIRINPVLFNRNPAVSTPWKPLIAWPSTPSIPPENSAQLTDDDPVDYVIFAGTPEWSGGIRAGRVHEFILRRRLRCAFLGVGLGAPETLRGNIVKVLEKHTDVFVARDSLAQSAATQHFTADRHSCPAILCCQTSRPRPSRPRRVGLVIQASKTRWHSVPPEVRDYLLAQYRVLSQHFEPVFIAHYLDDLALAQSLGLACYYSFRAEDYESFYTSCDLVVTPRVHGAGIAASLGIPSILVSHDGRAETGHGFGAIIAAPGTELLTIITQTDWKERSLMTINLKESASSFYTNKLRGISVLQPQAR